MEASISLMASVPRFLISRFSIKIGEFKVCGAFFRKIDGRESSRPEGAPFVLFESWFLGLRSDGPPK